MADSNISFDTSDVSSIVSSINNDVQALTNVSSSISTSFSPLTNSDLFTEGLNKIVQKLNNIKTSYESISTAIGGQVNTYNDVETAVEGISDNYISYYDNGSTGISSRRNSRTDDLSTTATAEGTKISTTLDEEVKSIDDKTLIKFINFVSVNLANSATISDLFQEENSEALSKYLQSFYKEYSGKELTVVDKSIIRTGLLKNILNSTVELPKELKDQSIIKYKEYLIAFAKELNVSVADLFLNTDYIDKTKIALQNLYEGKVDAAKYNLDSNYQSEFKDLVEKVMNGRKITLDKLFNNPIYLV